MRATVPRHGMRDAQASGTVHVPLLRACAPRYAAPSGSGSGRAWAQGAPRPAFGPRESNNAMAVRATPRRRERSHLLLQRQSLGEASAFGEGRGEVHGREKVATVSLLLVSWWCVCNV